MGWYVDEDPDAFHKSVPNEIATLSTVTPADNDVLLIEDASDGYTKKKVLAGSLGGGGGGGSAGWSPILDEKPGSDTPDDDFDTSTLNGKWTAVAGTSGTVNLLESGNVSRYDLSSRPGWLLMQAGSNGSQRVALRQDYTLPDGGSIVAALAPTAHYDASTVNNEYWTGIALNDNDGAFDAGSWAGLFFDVDANSGRYIFSDGSLQGDLRYFHIGTLVYLRIARAGLTYSAFISFDGSAWIPLGKSTKAAALSNIWIFTDNRASFGNTVPVQAVDWIRQGTNNVDPW